MICTGVDRVSWCYLLLLLLQFWHGSDGSTKLKPVLISSRLKAASQQQQQQEGEPDLDAALYADGLLDSDILQGGGCSPRQPLRRNNSSSATPAWDSGQELSGFADAAERELDDDLSRALLLSKQEFEQQQKLSGEGGEGDEDVAVQLPDEMDGDDSFQVPSWIEEQHVPAEAAAPPASPVHAGGPAETPPADFAGELLRQQQQDRQHQRERQQAGAADLYARSPAAAAGAADTAVADGIFAFTPPQGHQQQQAGLGAAMDLDGGAGAGADCAGPSSPALLAPQPDRSGRVSSSTAPGGSQLRPAGQKLGGGAAAAASPASAAAAAAALLRNGNQGVSGLIWCLAVLDLCWFVVCGPVYNAGSEVWSDANSDAVSCAKGLAVSETASDAVIEAMSSAKALADIESDGFAVSACVCMSCRSSPSS